MQSVLEILRGDLQGDVWAGEEDEVGWEEWCRENGVLILVVLLLLGVVLVLLRVIIHQSSRL